MPSKQTNRVLYLDEHVAVIEGQVQAGVDGMLPLMLKAGTNELHPLKPIEQMLVSAGSPVAGSCFAHGATLADVDASALHELGFNANVMGVPAYGMGVNVTPRRDDESPLKGTSRRAVSVGFVRTACGVAQYLARLALTSMGDMRSAHVLTRDGSRFETDVPTLGPYGRDWLSVELLGSAPYMLSVSAERAGDKGSVHVEFEPMAPRGDDASYTSAAANCLLSLLLNASSGNMYEPDLKSGLPTQNPLSDIPRAIVSAARSGSLSGCPYCGWPVIRPTKSADRFCRKSHRTRFDERSTHEAIVRILDETGGGATFEDVRRRVPSVTYPRYEKAMSAYKKES